MMMMALATALDCRPPSSQFLLEDFIYKRPSSIMVTSIHPTCCRAQNLKRKLLCSLPPRDLLGPYPNLPYSCITKRHQKVGPFQNREGVLQSQWVCSPLATRKSLMAFFISFWVPFTMHLRQLLLRKYVSIGSMNRRISSPVFHAFWFFSSHSRPQEFLLLYFMVFIFNKNTLQSHTRRVDVGVCDSRPFETRQRTLYLIC